MQRICLACLAVLLISASYPPPRNRGTEYVMPPQVYALYKNRRGPKGQGSCVWASCAMAGAHHDVREAEALLDDPNFGDGAWPGRVEGEFQRRRIPAWNIEGSQTIRWIEWALKTGRHVPITYGSAHMICAVGISPDRRTFYLVDNNYPTETRAVSRAVFLREHRGFSGGWAVILKTQGPPPWRPPNKGTRR